MQDRKKILIVEDEPEFRLGLKMRLESKGYEVLEAEDGASGLSKAKSEKPDLIVLDVMLPKMDGYQVARFLKFDEKFKSIPIIMLTARSQQTDRNTGQAVGVDFYMTKPFKSEELLAAIVKLLG